VSKCQLSGGKIYRNLGAGGLCASLYFFINKRYNVNLKDIDWLSEKGRPRLTFQAYFTFCS